MKSLLALTATAALAAGAAYADCPYPAAPDKLPDGASATLQDMLAGQKAVISLDHVSKALADRDGCRRERGVDRSAQRERGPSNRRSSTNPTFIPPKPCLND